MLLSAFRLCNEFRHVGDMVADSRPQSRDGVGIRRSAIPANVPTTIGDDLPKILPSPDDVAFGILQNVLHLSPWILGPIIAAYYLKQYFDLATRAAERAGRISSKMAGGLSRAARSGGLPLVLAVSVCVGLAQALLLPLAFVYGNLVSIDVNGLISGDTSLTEYDHNSDDGRRIDAFVRVWNHGSWSTAFDPHTYAVLHLDLPCLIVMVIYVLGVVASYKQFSREGRVGRGGGFLASFPFSLLVFPAAAGLVITLFNVWAFGVGEGRSLVELKFLTGATLVCLAYWVLCEMAVRASQISGAVLRSSGALTSGSARG